MINPEMVEVGAEVFINGERYAASQSIPAELWADPDFRKIVRQDLRYQIAADLADQLDVKYRP